ncbi:hypothetical protein OAQ19_00595 [bacterium]|nr:hypothetical protein [bacterium]
MSLERFFLELPYAFKNVIVSIYGFREIIKRKRRFFFKKKKTLIRNLYSPRTEVDKYRQAQLKKLVQEAFSYSEYYKKVMTESGITIKKLETEDIYKTIASIPFLEKGTLKNNVAEVSLPDTVRRPYAIVNTSGTTGSPMKIPFDSEGRQSTYAEWARYHHWLHLPKWFKSIRFSGRIFVAEAQSEPPFWVHNYLERQLFMSSYHLKEENLSFYVDKIKSYRPHFIDGYPSAIYVIAEYILRNDIKINFSPNAISVTAETLFDYQRSAIETAFGCKVFNQYASSEGAPWIVQCSKGSYHVWDDTGLFEFINVQESAHGETTAEMVVSSFRNLKTPLLRYRIGDTVVLPKKPYECTCGSSYPVILGILGRSDDVLYTEERGQVGRLDPVYKGVNGIIHSQIIQHNMSEVEVLLKVDADFTEASKAKLMSNLKDRLGGKLAITLSLVDSIPDSVNGKIKAVVRRFSV